MNRKIILSIILALSLSLLLVGCEENNSKGGNDSVKDVEEDFEIDEEMETKIRGANLAESIIRENFEDVKLEDFKINTEIDDLNMINNADFYLYLDNDNEDEVEKIIDEYGEIFAEKFGELESFLGITLYWMTPNHDRDNAIERDYI